MVRDNLHGLKPNLSVEYPINNKIGNNKLTTYFENETQTLIITWEGSASSNEIRQGYAYVMELIRYYRPVKWLLDLQNRDALKKADQRWVFTHFFPEALRLLASDIFVAIILPVHAFPGHVDELDGDELMQGDNFLIINHFLYKQEAVRWLESKKGIKTGA